MVGFMLKSSIYFPIIMYIFCHSHY